MTRIIKAFLVLIGRYKAYDPKKYFISRYSDKPRAKKVKDNGQETT